MLKVVIAGGTGFIGKFITSKFKERGDEVIIISREAGDVQWSDETSVIRSLNNADVVVNLSGKSVDCRYSDKNRKAILKSRVDTTRKLGNAILACTHAPKLWINSSTATIYRHADDRPMTEVDGEIGNGFSVDVARQWEKAFFDFNLANTRQVALRIAIVLGRNGGVMQPLQRLVDLGLGGKQGRGNQMFSWIHIHDLYQIMMFIVDTKGLKGVFNCSTPNPVSNEALMKSIRDLRNMKVGLPAPTWLLKIGAFVIRTEPELILKSRWVLPDRLIKSGYKFIYPTLQPALEQILTR